VTPKAIGGRLLFSLGRFDEVISTRGDRTVGVLYGSTIRDCKTHERPSIGVLLCASKDDEVVQYALSRTVSWALIAEYKNTSGGQEASSGQTPGLLPAKCTG
jgi:hypothetical protein